MTRRGYILVEVSLAYLVLSLAVIALIPVFILTLRANKGTEKIQAAAYLSAELLDEVRLRKWDETVTASQPYAASPSAIGRDSGESATDKRDYDDVDDFNGWSEIGVKDPVMRAMSEYSAYNRSVVVKYVDANLLASGVPTDLKQVTVCTQSPAIKALCLDTLIGNH